MTKNPNYGVAPEFSIEGDELDALLQPFVFSIGGEQYALKSVNSFSIDDYGDVLDLAEEDVAKVVGLVALDDRTTDFLKSTGAVIVKRVLQQWIASQGVTPGESDSSEA